MITGGYQALGTRQNVYVHMFLIHYPFPHVLF